jgi:hypothetical protein
VVPPTWIHLRWVLALPLIAFLQRVSKIGSASHQVLMCEAG